MSFLDHIIRSRGNETIGCTGISTYTYCTQSYAHTHTHTHTHARAHTHTGLASLKSTLNRLFPKWLKRDDNNRIGYGCGLLRAHA